MKITTRRLLINGILLSFLLAFFLSGRNAHAQGNQVVRAVLFYRSSCSHCVELVNQVMPPILSKYGESLQIFYCDVSNQAGDDLFTAAIEQFHIQTIGVPTLIIGETVLIGSRNIEEKIPAAIEAGLAGGGVDWPKIPGLEAGFATAGSMEVPSLGNITGPSDLLPQPEAGTESASTAPGVEADSRPVWRQRFEQDPRGNTVAVVVLIGMIGAVGYGVVSALRKSVNPAGARHIVLLWIVPVLCLIGVGISAYLAYVEITLGEAICGPVGNCNVVQSSPYARLFGAVPMGLVGAGGYIAILIAWLVHRFGRGRAAQGGGLALFGLALGGLGFSIYLTFLEPFVIGATCLWCLGSAVVMTGLFLLSVPKGKKIQRGFHE